MRMTRAVGIECFLWIVRAAMLVVVWSKKGRAYVEEQVYARIAMSVIIYLLSGNQHWVSERLKHVSAGMQQFIAYIAEGLEQIVREGRALSARVIETMLFGNFYAYVHFYFAVMMAGRFLSDKLQGCPEYASELPTTEFENRAGFEWKDDSMTAMTEAESLETDTGMTVVKSLGADELIKESFGDKSFGSSVLECDTGWSTVVNGVRYFGNAMFQGASSFGTADASEDTSEEREETTKERNRRLLMQDRSIQAGQKKAKRSKRSSRNFTQARKMQTVVEEDSSGESGITVDNTPRENNAPSCARLKEVKAILRSKGRLSVKTGRVRRQHRRKIKVRGSFARGALFEFRRLATQYFSRIVTRYSCSAVRYARFRSNRRFKPGD